MTDFHIQSELSAYAGCVQALQHAQEQKPDLILVGGDMIMDGLHSSRSRTRAQWQLWNKALREHVSIPVHACLGNHDVWGWDKSGSQTTGQESLWGKRWALEMLGLPRSYYSFDAGGWHFIALDSIQPVGSDFGAWIDEEQFAWLEADLSQTRKDTPILVLSHVPIVSTTPIFSQEYKEGYKIAGSAMHQDSRRLKDLFKKHTGVKVCLSGHTHMVDRVDYLGVSYLCGGAICGAWWMGSQFEFEPGYTMLDLFPDGRFESRYVPWGWKRG